MAKILLVWELGGGLGHVTVLRPVAEALKQRGHQVLLAARDLGAAEKVFRGTGIPFVSAPYKQGNATKPFVPQRSFAHLLHHAGFENEDELAALFGAWSGLFDAVEPDVTIFDHSPTALLASRGRDMRRSLIGTGFCAPPARDSLPDMRPWLPVETVRLREDERRTLDVANRVLMRNGQSPLRRLSDIYGRVDENLLTTFSELDHFGPRDDATYWGTFQACPGIKPEWPPGGGIRIFAYLKRTKGLSETIQILGKSAHSTIIFAPWANREIRTRHRFSNLHFSSEPLDIEVVAQECDLAVLNGTHGTTAQLLLSGKPILQLPIYLEQRLVAQKTMEMGAGLAANRTMAPEIEKKLEIVANSSQFRRQAEAFASKYGARNQQQRFDEMIARIEFLAG